MKPFRARKLPASLCGALLFCLLGLCSCGRFLDGVCSLRLFALAFQAQGDKTLSELSVVHDSILRLGKLSSCTLSNNGLRTGNPTNRAKKHLPDKAEARNHSVWFAESGG